MTLSIKTFMMSMLTLTLAISSYAQQASISGQITEASGEPVSFANVALLTQEEKLITGTVTEADGKFSLRTEAGDFIISISSIGFEAKKIKVTVTEGEELKLQKLVLAEDTEVLDAVTVKSLRPIIEMEPDKMVVTIEGTAMSEGNTAFDVLGKTPGVFVDQDGNIQLNGKQGILVMIDDRQTYMSATELQTLLESMPADNIRNIELITNPSARYDAEGVGGIININLKKNHMVGMNGSVYAGHEYNRYHGFNSGVNINYKRDKLSTFVNVDYSRRNRYRDNGFDRNFEQSGQSTNMTQEGEWRFTNHVPSIRTGLDYDITDKHSVGFNVRTTFFTGKDDFSMVSEVTEGSQPPTFISSQNLIDRGFTNFTSNVHYVGKLDSLGRRISVDLDYANMNMMSNATFLNRYTSASGEALLNEQLANDNPVNYDIFAFRSDYVHPLANGRKLEMGVKASRVISDNNLQFERLGENGWEEFTDMSNHFIYREHIFAGYANFNSKLGDNWSLKAGVRAEQTFADGYSVTMDSSNIRSYLNFFPSVFLQQRIKENYSLTYSYSRRINRPNYESLNPFAFYIDPFTLAMGNPNLNPSFSNNVEFTQTFYQRYNLTVGYSRTEGAVAEVPLFNEETNTTVLQVNNLDRIQNVSIRAIAPVQIAPWWQMQNVLVLNYNEVYSNFGGGDLIAQDIFNIYTQSGNTFMLPKGFRVELNGTYMSPQVYGAFAMKEMWWIDTAVKKSFLDNQLDVSVSFNDIFRSNVFTGTANFQGQNAVITQYNGWQSVRFSVRYRFNKGMKFEASRRNGGLEEISRTGNN